MTTRLAAAMQAFDRMYEPHEAREDTVVFPAFREIVPPADLTDLGEHFAGLERQQFHADEFTAMVNRVAEIEQELASTIWTSSPRWLPRRSPACEVAAHPGFPPCRAGRDKRARHATWHPPDGSSYGRARGLTRGRSRDPALRRQRTGRPDDRDRRTGVVPIV
jgi:hypothetical protein